MRASAIALLTALISLPATAADSLVVRAGQVLDVASGR